MEGGKEMSDVLLGMIIGGVIGVVGSAVVACIQGYYSLKTKGEENSALQHQQSTQIQHEKDSQLISRRIAVRSRYLEPLTSHLCSLYTAMNKYQEKLIEILHPYYHDRKTDEIQVPKVNKQEFMRQLTAIQSTLEAISTSRDKIWEVSPQVADLKLIQELTVLSKAATAFYAAHTEMYRSLHDSTTEQDFVYDSKAIMESLRKVELSISSGHLRIESLLAGVDEDDE
jgi:gas vesicle protein